MVFTSLDPFKGRGSKVATFAADPKADYRWVISPRANRISLVNNQNANIDVLSLDGQPARKISVKGYLTLDRLYWASDGKGFYVSTLGEDSTLLSCVHLQRKSHMVWSKKGGLGTTGIPSPDAKHIAMQSWTLNTNLGMMENF
jgi:hypothetical protein